MYKFKKNLPCDKERLFRTKTELLNFKFALPLAKLDIIRSRAISNVSIFFS